jgi:site-specific recombinase XerD
MDEQDFIKFITIKKGLVANSVKLCRIRFNIIKNWLIEHNKDLNKEGVEDFIYGLKQKGLKNNSINTYIFCLRYIRDYCKDRGLPSDFLDGIESLPKNSTHIDILTADELAALFDISLKYGIFRGKDVSFLDQVMKAFTMFLALTGCRFSEAANLKVKYVDLARQYAYFVETKNKEERKATLYPQLVEALKPLLQGKDPEELVFKNAAGGRVHPGDYSNDLKLRAKSAGITKRVHPHLFRHSYATQLLMSGVSLAEVKEIVGHKDIKTTMRYIHLADERLKRLSFRHPLAIIYMSKNERFAIMREECEVIINAYAIGLEKSIYQSNDLLRLEVK